MKIVNFTIILFCSLSIAKAQMTSSTNNKRIADVYFLNKEYYAAAEYYKKTLQISPDSLGFRVPYGFENKIKEASPKKEDYEYAVFQLATSLRLYKNFKDAEKWYAVANQFINEKYMLSGFWYGECLRANLKYEDAIVAFEAFLKKYKLNDDYVKKAKFEIESCKYAINEIKYPRLHRITRLSNNINSAGSNYAPFQNNAEFYFTSSRPIGNAGKNEVLEAGKNNVKVVKKETPYINTLYTIRADDPKSQNVSVKKVGLEMKKMESAAIALHPNGNLMFFTAWVNKEDKKRNIYMSKKNGDKWEEPIVLGGEVNVSGFNSMQPFITKDGKYLLFSSDRPGGLGKYDLWYAVLRPDGNVGNAINLGAKINTQDNEEAPYYHPITKKLLFSSDGRIGLGGFDFYESEGDFTDWSVPVNLGYPFNSAKDDVYFTALDDTGKEGYISSDRESICCLEVFHVTREYINVFGTLVDCVTKKPLQGATITLTGVDTEKQIALTNAEGKYQFQVGSNRGIQVNAAKENYFAKSISFNYEQLVKSDTLLSPDLCLEPMVIDKPIVLDNILYEFNSAELTELSKATLDTLYKIMIDNPNIEIELSSHTDIIGTEKYNLELSDRRAKSCVYYLIGRGISAERMTWKGYGFSRPIAPNKLPNGEDNPEGRALNRRTEFKVTKQKK
jgi:OmpA-OmpF porin, OOP family